MYLTREESKHIERFRSSPDIPHWYDRIFFAKSPHGVREFEVLVRKAKIGVAQGT